MVYTVARCPDVPNWREPHDDRREGTEERDSVRDIIVDFPRHLLRLCLLSPALLYRDICRYLVQAHVPAVAVEIFALEL